MVGVECVHRCPVMVVALLNEQASHNALEASSSSRRCWYHRWAECNSSGLCTIVLPAGVPKTCQLLQMHLLAVHPSGLSRPFPGKLLHMHMPRDGCKSSHANTNPAVGAGVALTTSICSLVLTGDQDAEARLWKCSLGFLCWLSILEAAVSARGYLFPI